MVRGWSRSLSAGLQAEVTAQNVSGRDAICGEWVTADGKARVLISRCEELYCGKIIWLKEPLKDGKEVVDYKNPDEKLRTEPVLGLVIVRNFEYDGEDEWTGGKVYDPESGDTYSGKIKMLEDGTLKLRGYVLIPLFGRSEIWTRPVPVQ